MRCAAKPQSKSLRPLESVTCKIVHASLAYKEATQTSAQLLINITNSFITLGYVDLVTLHNEYRVLSHSFGHRLVESLHFRRVHEELSASYSFITSTGDNKQDIRMYSSLPLLLNSCKNKLRRWQ